MKIGAIIQARFDSERLPGKVLLELPFKSSVTVIEHIANRLKNSNKINEIILATSKEKNDKIIVEEGERIGINVFAGEKNDVLNRFIAAAELYKIDVIIRMTGDNPIIFTDLLDNCIQNHVSGGFDYTYSTGLPLGTNFEIVNYSSLKRIYQFEYGNDDKEHVTLFIRKNPERFKINQIDLGNKNTNNKIRLSIDYPSDFALMNIIFEELKIVNYRYNHHTITNIFEEYKWLSDINQSNYQKQQFDSDVEKTNEAAKILTKLGFEDLAKKLFE